MSFDPGDAFDFILCMYRNGLLDKLSAIAGEAMDRVMVDAGLGMGDLLNRTDLAGDRAVRSIDLMLGRAGPLFRHLAGDRLMRFMSRVLDIKPVRRFVLEIMKRSMLKAFSTRTAACHEIASN